MICFFILPVCHQDYESGILWGKQRTDKSTNVNCSDLHPSFQSDVNITRKCLDNRQWGSVDFSGCTMKPDSTLLVMIEVESLSTVSDSTMIRNDVRKRVAYMYIRNTIQSQSPCSPDHLIATST